MNTLTFQRPYDAVAKALAKAYKTDAELELERQAFRSRARRDARTCMRNYRNADQFLDNVETCLMSLTTAGHVRIWSVEVAIALLGGAMRTNLSHIGTRHYSGHKHIALRSRLVQARYFRRFGFWGE